MESLCPGGKACGGRKTLRRVERAAPRRKACARAEALRSGGETPFGRCDSAQAELLLGTVRAGFSAWAATLHSHGLLHALGSGAFAGSRLRYELLLQGRCKAGVWLPMACAKENKQ